MRPDRLDRGESDPSEMVYAVLFTHAQRSGLRTLAGYMRRDGLVKVEDQFLVSAVTVWDRDVKY